jgi:hypothetical protein
MASNFVLGDGGRLIAPQPRVEGIIASKMKFLPPVLELSQTALISKNTISDSDTLNEMEIIETR